MTSTEYFTLYRFLAMRVQTTLAGIRVGVAVAAEQAPPQRRRPAPAVE
jgi:hypothetical protein